MLISMERTSVDSQVNQFIMITMIAQKLLKTFLIALDKSQEALIMKMMLSSDAL